MLQAITLVEQEQESFCSNAGTIILSGDRERDERKIVEALESHFNYAVKVTKEIPWDDFEFGNGNIHVELDTESGLREEVIDAQRTYIYQ